MRQRCGACPARQDEFFEWLQRAVEPGDLVFKAGDMLFADDVRARNAQFSAKVEQIVLNAQQCGADRFRQLFSKQYAKAGIKFVDLADGFDAQAVFGNT